MYDPREDGTLLHDLERTPVIKFGRIEALKRAVICGLKAALNMYRTLRVAEMKPGDTVRGD